MEITLRNVVVSTGEMGFVNITRIDQPTYSFKVESHALGELIEVLSSFSFSHSHMRRTFRIPVFHSASLRVIVICGEKTFESRARDISTGGIFVLSPQNHDMNVEPNDLVTIKLVLGELKCTIGASTRRIEKMGTAFVFSTDNDNALFSLREIVSILHTKWMEEVDPFGAHDQNDPNRIRCAESLNTLTKKEETVLDLIMQGYANKVIAKSLNVTERTIENRRRRIFEKTNTKSLAELVRFVMEVRRFGVN